MAQDASPVSNRHFAYIAERTAQDDAFLTDLKAAAAAAGLPAIQINSAEASLVQILLRAAGARRVLEIGTLGGYSAIWMARALPEDGRVVTFEIEPRFAEFARAWIARSDVAARIEVRCEDAREALARLDGGFDAAFLDADKASYKRYLDECMRLVRPGGLILVDNAFAFGQLFDESPTDPEAPAVQEFNEYIARVPGLQSVIVPLGDGLWVGVRDQTWADSPP